MNKYKKEYILQWFDKADKDIIVAHKSIDSEPITVDPACFHCQQAVEKYLKAYLVYQGKDFEKTHDLTLLNKLCSEYDYDFENNDFKDLNDFSVDMRYPNNDPLPSLEETKGYLQMAESIRDLIRKKIILD